MRISKRILNAVSKKICNIEKEKLGYDVEVTFDDPISLKIKDGTAKLHLNVTASVDAALLLKLMEKELGSEE